METAAGRKKRRRKRVQRSAKAKEKTEAGFLDLRVVATRLGSRHLGRQARPLSPGGTKAHLDDRGSRSSWKARIETSRSDSSHFGCEPACDVDIVWNMRWRRIPATLSSYSSTSR